ncbi:MAG: outer membrane protein assembly factor BamA [Treponema sp.]|nr:outer membrane protein assembly factor BamA [Treponema sp.]
MEIYVLNMRTFMHIKRLLSVFLFFFVAGFTLLSAQESDDWYYGKPIRDIKFKGLHNISESDLRGVTEPFIGEEFSDELFADLMNRLFAMDFFEDIEPSAVPVDKNNQAVRIIVEVVEKPIVQKVRFLGSFKIKNDTLKEQVSTKDKGVFDESKLESDVTAIRNLYYSKGYSEIEVSASTEKGSDGIIVTFNIKEGSQVVVKDIFFTGNRMVSARTLRGKLTSKKATLLDRNGFSEASIEQDKKAIMQYYAENGYIDVNIINVEQKSEFNEKKNRQEITLTFNIEEGSQYTFAGLTIQGNEIFKTEELLSLVRLKAGDVFNITKFQEGMSEIQSKYTNSGYWTNQYQPQMDRDSDAKTVSYSLYILEGERSHIESINIVGNTRTKNEVIMRELPMEEGDVFSNEKVTTGLRSLYNLQYFSSIVPEVTPGSEENLVDLTIKVAEQSTRSLQFGLNFSGSSTTDEFPISLNFGLSDSNLFGEGKTLSLSTSLATNTQSVSASYGLPYLFGKPISNTLSLSYNRSKLYSARNVFLPDGSIDNLSNYFDFVQHKISLSDSIARRWQRRWGDFTLAGGGSLAMMTNIYDGDSYIPTFYSMENYHNKWNPRNSLFGQVSLDARDFFFNPSKGWFASERVTWIGLMPKGVISEDFGETEFILRSTSTGEAYFQLVNKPLSETMSLQLILAGISQVTYQRPMFSTTISAINKLSLDGMVFGRGWEISDQEWGNGDLLWNNSLELRYPVFKNALSIDLFFDASMVKDLSSGNLDISNASNWFFSFGPGLRLLMQQLPLRVYLANNFTVNDGLTWRKANGNTADNFLSGWHFVLSFASPNK